jgi:hypothetical protein
MVAEWAGKDGIQLVHPLLGRWLGSCLSLPHGSTSLLPSESVKCSGYNLPNDDMAYNNTLMELAVAKNMPEESIG